MKKECPKCRSLNVEKKSDRISLLRLVWGGGLGTPATILHEYIIWLCKDCSYEWEFTKLI